MAEAPKRYRVLNPRGLRAGTPLIGYTPASNPEAVQRWYEGDVFEVPPGFDRDGRLLRDGFVEEVIADG